MSNGENEGNQGQHAVERIVALAETSPVVTNGLLSQEQTAYCLGIQEQLPHLNHPRVAMYGGMGPDISTVLLTTNANRVYGIEHRKVNLDRVAYYLDKWDEVDSAALDMPAIESMIRGPRPEQALEDAFSQHRNFGYWDESTYNLLPLERLMVIELKKMGVNPATVILEEQDAIHKTIHFAWAFPGEAVQKRSITYVDETRLAVANPGSRSRLRHLSLPSAVDIYYEKALPTRGADFRNVTDIATLVPHGAIILGQLTAALDRHPPATLRQKEEEEARALQALGFNEITDRLVPFAQAMAQHTDTHIAPGSLRSQQPYYGWQCRMFTRS